MTRVAVVTGAGRGIGKACALRLADDFDVVVAADLDAGSSARTAAELPDGKGHPFAVDVSDGDAVAGLADFAASLGSFGGLAHVAAISPTMADWRRLVEVDLRGSALVLGAFDALVVSGSAAVCFSSCSAYLLGPTPDPEILAILDEPLADDLFDRLVPHGSGPSAGSQVAYPWAKLAVQRLAARTAVAWGPRGGRVLSVSPGIIDTPQARQEAEGSAVMELMLDRTPVGRWGTAEELADFVAYTLSPRAGYLSGTDVLVDGGQAAGLAEAGGLAALLGLGG